MFNAYNEAYGTERGTSQPPLTPSMSLRPSSSSSIHGVIYSWQCMLSSDFGTLSSSSLNELELEMYLDIDFTTYVYNELDASLDFNKFDLLTFWRQHWIIFCVISKTVRDLLTIPMSTITSE